MARDDRLGRDGDELPVRVFSAAAPTNSIVSDTSRLKHQQFLGLDRFLHMFALPQHPVERLLDVLPSGIGST